MTRRVFNYGGGMHSPAALTQFLRDALDGDVANGMEVVAGSGMNVTVKAGTASVGKDPSYDINIVGTETVSIGAASPSNPTNTLIVAYVDRSVSGSTAVTDNTNDVFKLKAVSGAAAATPSDPTVSAVQAAIGAANPYIVLARVLKRAGATSIIDSDITDLRKMITLRDGRINKPEIISDGTIVSGHIKDKIILPQHLNWGDFIQAKRDNTNQPVEPVVFQYGRARAVAPTDTIEATTAIAFPKIFKSGTVPTVICTYNGYGNANDPWTDTPNPSWAGATIGAVSITNSSFAARCRRFDGAMLRGSYYFSWMAIGAV